MRLDVREVARLFDVSEPTVYRWISEDELPSHEVEGQSRFHRAEVLEWATARDITPSPELFDDDAALQGTSVAAALERGGIHAGVPAHDRDVAISAIVERLPLTPEDRALVGEVLHARPDLGKTGLAEGIAIPHVRHPLVLDVPLPSITLCFLERPLAAGPDQAAVQTVFTLVAPSVRKHLVMLSRLAFAVHEPSVREALAGRDPALIIAGMRALEAAR